MPAKKDKELKELKDVTPAEEVKDEAKTVEETVEEPKTEEPKAEEPIVEDDTSNVVITDPVVVRSLNEVIVPMVNMSKIYIGGVYYDFVKGKEQKVPVNVADVLRSRDLIK